MMTSFINYLFNRITKVKRYSSLGDIFYHIEYCKDKEFFILKSIKVIFDFNDNYFFDFSNDVEPLRYKDKQELRKMATELGDINLTHSLYLQYRIDVSLFNNRSDMVADRINTDQLP